MFFNFAPGELTRSQADRLNELMRTVEAMRSAPPSPPPFPIRQNSVTPILAVVTGNNGATIPVHTANRQTKNIQTGVTQNSRINYIPIESYTQVLDVNGGTIPVDTLVVLYPLLDYQNWYWAIPAPVFPFVSNVCLTKIYSSGVFVDATLTVQFTNPDGSLTCVVDPVDCCPIIQTCTVCAGLPAPTQMYLSLVTNGCALPLCPYGTGAGQVSQGPLIYQLIAGKGYGWCNNDTAVCADPPGQTACINVSVCMYCVAGAYVVDVTRIQENADCTSGSPTTHTALPVTVADCIPFCGTFTVPGDAVCASSTVYRISADPAATCGASPPPPPGPPTYNPLGTGQGGGLNVSTTTGTISSVTVPAGTLLVVAIESIVAVGTLSGVPPTVTYGGTPMGLVGSSASNSYSPSQVTIQTDLYALHITSTTTATISATVNTIGGTASGLFVLLNAAYYSGLTNFAPDEMVNAIGAVSMPDTGTSGTTSHAVEAVYAGIGLFDVSPPSLGSWQNGFTAGQENVLSTGLGDFRLRDGYLILASTTTFDAATNDTRLLWGAVATSFS